MSMWLTSCYILGGTIWKKGSWLITSAALLVFSFVLLLLMQWLGRRTAVADG